MPARSSASTASATARLSTPVFLLAVLLLVLSVYTDMAAPIRRTADGKVDLASVQAHVAHLKGKYAQNAANYERNTGHKLSFASAGDQPAQDGHADSGNDKQSQTDAAKDAPSQAGDGEQAK